MGEKPEVIEPDSIEPDNDKGDSSLIVPEEILPEDLLVIPLYDRPTFPKMMGPVIIDDPRIQEKIIASRPEKDPMYVGLVLAKPNDEGLPRTLRSKEDFYEVGVAARVVQLHAPAENNPMQLLVQGVKRFTILTLKQDLPLFRARVLYWKDAEVKGKNAEIKAYSVAIIDSIKELVNLNPLFKEGLSLLLERINLSDPGALADFAASMTTSTGDEIQAVLETVDVIERLEAVLVLLKKELEISKLKAKISKRIEEQLSKQQREFFLKQQLKEIKKELGLEKDDTQSEIEKFQKRIAALTLTEEAKERVDEEIEKLKLLGSSSAEFNVSRAYLDWLTLLPWGITSRDNYDLKKAARILDRDHYGLQDVKDRILELMSVGIVKGDLSGSILLLVGPPGVGKTSIGRSIAESLGREFFRFSLGGMRDEAEIKGHRRTYIGALPGKFIQAMKSCKTSNPLIMLDEIDKIGASFRGDPASALLEVLDPEQNKDFLDHYLDVRFDLSNVLFICTANQMESIPAPLIDRMEVIRLSGYILKEKVEIAARHLVPKQLKAHGLTKKQVTISKPVISAIIDGYAREAGVRGLENSIKKILRKTARKIVDQPNQNVRIKKNELKQLLGKRIFSQEQVFATSRVGVVTGLAYTSLGGTTLHVEAISVKKSGGGFKQTGQLGKVMVESSEIAYSYVRSFLSDDEDAVEFFNNHQIHLHVPAGATPKDGPSAGITMATALYSLVKKQKMNSVIAMTGELTLSGLVMPIGGVKEKIIAAARSKVKQVLLPKENQEDFDLLPDHIKDGLTVQFVSTYDEVRDICF